MKATSLDIDDPAGSEPQRQAAASFKPYFFDVPTGCPYGLPQKAVYHQALLGSIPAPVLAQFMAAGYRRSGNNLYTMACPECRRCVPIRLKTGEFRPSRNQRRVWQRNRDLTVERGPLQIDAEKLALCNKFLRHRYPGRGNSAEEYFFGFFLSSITNVFEICYRTPGGRLVGAAVVDAGADWLNAVYFYFDPQEGKRSPGTFNILSLLELSRQSQIEHLYLGYWIDEVPAMNYKIRFKPHYLLRGGKWRREPAIDGRPPSPARPAPRKGNLAPTGPDTPLKMT